MVTLLEVMSTSQVTITSQEVIVTSPINEQMVEAIATVSHTSSMIKNPKSIIHYIIQELDSLINYASCLASLNLSQELSFSHFCNTVKP